MKFKSMKKMLMALGITTALLLGSAISAFACTTIYVGANLTEENTPFVARTEDYGANMNKQWYLSEAGAFKAGTTYRGCPAYGAFEWTFTHDSYALTYFTNDIYYDSCPECGEGEPGNPPTHYSYTEFGSNEHGVAVSATETIYGSAAVKAVDPMHTTLGNAGIEETDIPFVLLAEAASAREGVELLMKIYDERGAYFASGLFISDRNETWYIENCSGTQYVAIKLHDDLIFLEPNMAIIGEIDLDDENVLYSDRLIEVAKQAGTFVGNEAENVIDFRASYADLGSNRMGGGRLEQGLNYLNKNYNYTVEDLIADNTKFTISNVNAAGEIVPFYTNIKADRQLDKDDVFGYYKLSTIGYERNQEIEIFQLFSEEDYPELEDKYAVVGWVAVADMSKNVFVPYFPMLLDEVYEAYQVSTPVVKTLDPATNAMPDGFATWTVNRRTGAGSYVQYPDNWRDSYYFTFEALGGIMKYAENLYGAPLPEATVNYVNKELAKLQKELYDDFVTVAELKASDDERALATANGKAMAEKAHKKALELVDYVLAAADEMTPNFKDVAKKSDIAKAVDYVSKKNLMIGVGDGTTFAPYMNLTRAQLVQILYAKAGKPAVTAKAEFTDVAADAWYADAVSWAVANGITAGVGNGAFAPDAAISREQLAVFLYADAGKPAVEDKAIEGASDWAQQAMVWAVNANAFQIADGAALNPQNNAVRGEVAVALMNTAK